ncbi:hypothetical protein [Micromonospora zingiberis]|nr:hypothetical protein [Micromonospora zingiberis]
MSDRILVTKDRWVVAHGTAEDVVETPRHPYPHPPRTAVPSGLA